MACQSSKATGVYDPLFDSLKFDRDDHRGLAEQYLNALRRMLAYYPESRPSAGNMLTEPFFAEAQSSRTVTHTPHRTTYSNNDFLFWCLLVMLHRNDRPINITWKPAEPQLTLSRIQFPFNSYVMSDYKSHLKQQELFSGLHVMPDGTTALIPWVAQVSQ